MTISHQIDNGPNHQITHSICLTLAFPPPMSKDQDGQGGSIYIDYVQNHPTKPKTYQYGQIIYSSSNFINIKNITHNKYEILFDNNDRIVVKPTTLRIYSDGVKVELQWSQITDGINSPIEEVKSLI